MEVVSCWLSPVSSSVMLILYSVMIPLVSSRGGGAQESWMDVELMAVALISSGGADGAVQYKNK